MRNLNHKILSINLDGRYENLLKLEEFIRHNQPLICLLQDIPRLNRESLIATLSTIAMHYGAVFDENQLELHKQIDNTILFHKERLSLTSVHLYNTRSKASSIGISISRIYEEHEDDQEQTSNPIQYGKLTIFSVYIRPRAMHQETRDCLNWILETSKQSDGYSRTIVMGDMNASETSWCPVEETLNNKEHSEKHYRQIKIVRGRMIAKHFERMKLSCMNKPDLGPTYESEQTKSYIDLAFVGNKAIRTWNKLTIQGLWDPPAHKALVLQSQSISYRKRTYKRVRIELLNDSMFTEAHLQCDPLCTNWKQLPRNRIIRRMDRMTNVIYNTILAAQRKITTRVTKKAPLRNGNCNRGILDARIRQQIGKLRKRSSKIIKLRHKIKRAQSRGGEYRGAVLSMLNKKRTLRQKMAKLRRGIIDNMTRNNLSECYNDLGQQNLWDKVHRIEGLLNNRVNNNHNEARGSDRTLRAEADIEKLADEKFPYKQRCTLQYVDNAYNNSPYRIRNEISEEEIMAAVGDLKNKSYTSAEGIKMDLFYRALEFVASIVRTLIEMSFWTCYIPKKVRITQGTLIPKKAPGQFRIVHVSSPLAALFELIALRRLEFRLEKLKLNSSYQFGFSAQISRHDLIARLLEFFYKEYLEIGKDSFGLIISLDIEGAFDNVNQDRLIEQLDKELGSDPIKYWLASFILNRKISIKKENLKSSIKDISMGVPQGSALGPILWNYMIHNLDKDIVIPGKLELIRYADDIILIYNGNDRKFVQHNLNILVNKLREIDLSIRPEKCSFMGVRLGRLRERRKLEYRIDGIPIKKVDKINILGVPITHKLRLDRQSPEHIDKLNKSIKKLHNINRLGLINTAKEWRILVESFIKSRLIINHWPILIIDHESCKWVDELMIKALRVIFNWPTNTSIKLIKLITGTLNCRDSVIRTARVRSLTEFKPIYEFLLKIGQYSPTQDLLNLPQRDRMLPKRINLETSIKRRRKHPDPTKLISITEAESFRQIVNRDSSTWILLDRGTGSMLAEINRDMEVMRIKLIRHNQYPISYFNSFALILKITSEDMLGNNSNTCHSKSLTLSETNSLVSALENTQNRDWRVIELREKIVDSGWKLNKIRLLEDRRLRELLTRKHQGITLRHDMSAIMNDFNIWLALNNEITEQREQDNTRPIHRVESVDEPYLLDYWLKNRINKRALAEDTSFFKSCHTNITKALSSSTEIWQSLPTNWLDGLRMLVLAGMSTNENGQIIHGEREPSDTCHLCTDSTLHNNRVEDNDNWHGIDANTIKSNLVLHKAFKCRRFILERTEFLKHVRIESSEATNNVTEVTSEGNLDSVLLNRRLCQKLLTFMVKCNMTNGH